MTIRTRQWGLTAAVLLALSGLTSCTGDTPLNNGNPNTTPGEIDRDAQQRRAGRTEPQALGGLKPGPKSAAEVGAPIDPCGLSWNDFPPAVRPTDGQPHAPKARKPPPDTKWDLECIYDNSGPIPVNTQTGASGDPEGGYFIATVIWQKSGTADPANNPGSQAKTWNGKPGFLKAAPDDPKLGSGCMASVRLTAKDGSPGGASAIFVSNSRFPAKGACDVVDHVAAVMATKNQ